MIRQQRTRMAERLLADGAGIAVWWATPVECASAVARLLRERVLDAAGAHGASSRLHEISRHWIEIEPSASLRRLACALAPRHAIRAADALQLAAARVWSGESTAAAEFVTFDERLRAAAQDEGFTVRGG